MTATVEIAVDWDVIQMLRNLILLPYPMLPLDWSVCTCLTQLYGGRDMYNSLHTEQLHVSALFIGHLQVDK